MTDAARITESATDGEQWIELVERLTTLVRLLRRELAALADEREVGDSQLSVLWACRQNASGASQVELAEALALSAAHISGLVEQLRKAGLLAGQRSGADRRRQVWRLTETGSQRLADIAAAAQRLTAASEPRLHAIHAQLAGYLSPSSIDSAPAPPLRLLRLADLHGETREDRP